MGLWTPITRGAPNFEKTLTVAMRIARLPDQRARAAADCHPSDARAHRPAPAAVLLRGDVLLVVPRDRGAGGDAEGVADAFDDVIVLRLVIGGRVEDVHGRGRGEADAGVHPHPR